MWCEFEVKCMSLEVIHACFSIINYTTPALPTEAIFLSCPNTSGVLVFIIKIIIIRETAAWNAWCLTPDGLNKNIDTSWLALLQHCCKKNDPEQNSAASAFTPATQAQAPQPLDTSASEMKQWKSLADSFRVYCMCTNLHLEASFENFCAAQQREVSSQATLEAGWISSGGEALGVGGNLLSSFTKTWAHRSGKRPRGSVCMCACVCLECRAEGQQAALLCRSVWCLPELQFIWEGISAGFEHPWPFLPDRPTFARFCQLNALSEQERCVWLLICLWVGGSVPLPF